MPYKPKTHGQRQKDASGQPKVADMRESACKRGYDRKWQKRRIMVLKRDYYLCQDKECGRPVGASGHVDHIIPKAKGGTDDMDNLQTLCRECHSVKTGRGE